MEWQRGVQLVAEVAEAISHAHLNDVFHRDLKPANILVRYDGTVCVVDFGLAVQESEQERLKGERAGSPAYMSPEQVRGCSHHLDGRADVWSLGVILYEVLSGRRPFRGADLLDEILHRPPRSPREMSGESIPRPLEEICLQTLAKDASDRPNAMDFARDLRDILAALETTNTRVKYPTNEQERRRAVVELAERARFWGEKPSVMRLPDPLSYFTFVKLTARDLWSETESRMMAQATRLLSIAGIATLVLIIACFVLSRHLINENAERRINALTTQLGSADADRVEAVLRSMAPYRPRINARIQERFSASQLNGNHGQALRYALALGDSQTRLDYLCNCVITSEAADTDEIRSLVLDAGRLDVPRVCSMLWDELEQPGLAGAGLHHIWPRMDAADRALIEHSDGRVQTEFAFCQSMTLRDFPTLAARLRDACYRPLRVRPYKVDDEVLVAAIWVRDPADWRFEYDIPLAQLPDADRGWRSQAFHVVDVGVYRAEDAGRTTGTRGCAVWLAGQSQQAAPRIVTAAIESGHVAIPQSDDSVVLALASLGNVTDGSTAAVAVVRSADAPSPNARVLSCQRSPPRLLRRLGWVI